MFFPPGTYVLYVFRWASEGWRYLFSWAWAFVRQFLLRRRSGRYVVEATDAWLMTIRPRTASTTSTASVEHGSIFEGGVASFHSRGAAAGSSRGASFRSAATTLSPADSFATVRSAPAVTPRRSLSGAPLLQSRPSSVGVLPHPVGLLPPPDVANPNPVGPAEGRYIPPGRDFSLKYLCFELVFFFFWGKNYLFSPFKLFFLFVF